MRLGRRCDSWCATHGRPGIWFAGCGLLALGFVLWTLWVLSGPPR